MTDNRAPQLPPWKCLNKRDAMKLIAWTNAKLDKEQALSEMFIQLGEFTRLNTFTRLDGYDYGHNGPTALPTTEYALEAYRDTGDLSLLQQADPDYAEYLSRRKRGRPSTPKRGDRIWEAVRDVVLIRQIWKESFGQFYRSHKDEVVVTAEQIAAKRWGVSEVTLGNRLKKLKPI